MKRLTTHIEETEALEQLDEGLLRNLGKDRKRSSKCQCEQKARRHCCEAPQKCFIYSKQANTAELRPNGCSSRAYEKSLEQMARGMIAIKVS